MRYFLKLRMAAYGDQSQLLKLAHVSLLPDPFFPPNIEIFTMKKGQNIFFYLALRTWRGNIFSMSDDDPTFLSEPEFTIILKKNFIIFSTGWIRERKSLNS
jgi:hypothetical protein